MAERIVTIGKKEEIDSVILFGYSCIPSEGCFGKDYGGFSVKILIDKRIIFREYIFTWEEERKVEYLLSEKTFSKIKDVLFENKEKIDSFERYIDNDSDDGEGNFFVFAGKGIVAWNISEAYICESEYEDEVTKCEIEILDIFQSVCEILKQENIYLELYQVASPMFCSYF